MKFIALIIIGAAWMMPGNAQAQSCKTASDCPAGQYECVNGTCVCECPDSAPNCEPDGTCGY